MTDRVVEARRPMLDEREDEDSRAHSADNMGLAEWPEDEYECPQTRMERELDPFRWPVR